MRALITEYPLRLAYYHFQLALRSPFLPALTRCNPTICSSLCGNSKKYLLFLIGLKRLYHTHGLAVNTLLHKSIQ